MHISKETRRRILLFLAALALTEVSQLLFIFRPHASIHGTLLYSAIVMAWALTLQRRITGRRTRYLLLGAAALFLLLFVLRIWRYEMPGEYREVQRILWYLYYIPFTAVPLLSLLMALCVGKDETEHLPRFVLGLCAAEAALSFAVFTNDLHGWAFHFLQGSVREKYTYGWLYFACLLWGIGLTLASLLVLVWRCRVLTPRHLWYVPLLCAAPGALLMALYFANGGNSPMLAGNKLFLLQEVFSLAYIGFFEGCIQVGLLPSNTDYERLFQLSHLNAALQNPDGTIAWEAGNYDVTPDGHFYIRRNHWIRGGHILWSEDITSIQQLQEELADATLRIEEENVLIREENRIEEEKAGYETRNRLYDRIALVLQPQLKEIDEVIDDPEKLPWCMFLGAYVKRRANLELLADRSGSLSTLELGIAIRESFEYLALSDVTCEVTEEGEMEEDARRILLAYDFFEAVLERTYRGMHACRVWIRTGSRLWIMIYVDVAELSFAQGWRAQECDALGMRLRRGQEDETLWIGLLTERRR